MSKSPRGTEEEVARLVHRFYGLPVSSPSGRVDRALSDAGAQDGADVHPHGWRRRMVVTRHKDIGTMYLLFALTMLMVGGVLAWAIEMA